MTVVDAHVHFWRLARGDYAWLTPDLATLYRDFVPDDLIATLDAHGVDAIVAVQAAQTEAETRYLLQLARAQPRIAGVVGWVDFDAADAAARIAALCAEGGGLLKGLRPMVQDLADPQWLARPSLDPAFDALLRHDLAFDALVKPLHLPALQARLQRHPQLRVVLDHAAKPAIGGDGFAAWADGLAQLARHPTVLCKLSGLLTELPDGAAAAAIAPYVAQVFACFGAQRVMWGSDWPVLTQRAGYGDWLAQARALVARHAAAHAADVFAGTARRFYHLPEFPPSPARNCHDDPSPPEPHMSGRLHGKRCLITAAGAGIGRESALACAREGAQVLATDIDAAALQALAAESATIATQALDVTDAAAIQALVAANAPFDVLFNCAGYVHQGSILDCDEPAWRRSFAINVDAMYYLCQAVLPGMLAQGRGSIVNMSSVASSIKGVPNRFAYGVTKAAVIGLSKAIAADYVAKGIRCNAICPGTIKTPSLGERVKALGGDEQAVWKSFTDRQPMGRLGDPREIAQLVVYLASDESSFTTGQTHIIDGGWSN